MNKVNGTIFPTPALPGSGAMSMISARKFRAPLLVICRQR
jgi:hypothetical protein